jgi:hypothetical protein
MNDAFVRITDIIRERGMDLMRSDMRDIEALLGTVDPDRANELRAWVYEGLFLIVNDPAYCGDVPPLT